MTPREGISMTVSNSLKKTSKAIAKAEPLSGQPWRMPAQMKNKKDEGTEENAEKTAAC